MVIVLIHCGDTISQSVWEIRRETGNVKTNRINPSGWYWWQWWLKTHHGTPRFDAVISHDTSLRLSTIRYAALLVIRTEKHFDYYTILIYGLICDAARFIRKCWLISGCGTRSLNIIIPSREAETINRASHYFMGAHYDRYHNSVRASDIWQSVSG